MKIRYVYDQLLPSRDTDTEQVLNTVAALGRRGVDVELVVPAQAGVSVNEQVLRDYYQVRGPFRVSSRGALFGRFRPIQKTIHGLRGALPRGGHDLVYTRNLHAIGFALAQGHRVAYEHFRPWADQYPPIEPALRALFRHRNFLGAILHSEHIQNSYARLGVPESRLVVCHNGYEPSRMEPRLSRSEARERLGLELEGSLVVYAGRVHERKGLLAVLELARRLPEVRFLIVGSEGEGRVEREARLVPNVEVRPWQRFDATIPFLYAADVLITPPTLEPLQAHGTTVLPMKLFMYLASGRVIFGPDAPDTRGLLRHGENALLVPADDLGAQVRELRSVLADAPRRERLENGALASAAHLTWDARAEKLERFLDARLAASASGAPMPEAARWDPAGWLGRTATWVRHELRRG